MALMKKLALLLFIVPMFALSLKAQQDPIFSHYMFNPYYSSPALTAFDGKSSLSLISRNQWTGYDPSFGQQGGAPSTQFFNYSTLTSVGKVPLAVGGTFIYDTYGPRRDTYVQLSLAYHFDYPRGRWSFGVRPSFINKTLDYSQLVLVDPSEFNSDKESEIVADLAAGLAYSSTDFLLAIGVDHLLMPSYDFGYKGATSNEQNLALSLFASYEYKFSQKLTFQPSLLAKSNLSGFSYDVGMRAIYEAKLWGGLSYRNMEAATLLLGYNFLSDNSLSVGYSFDYIVVNQEAKQASSHELYVRYNLPGLSGRTKKIVRTPRFRF